MSDLSSMFSDYKTWTSQLSTLLGDAEVDKFRNKLSSINVTGLDEIRLGVDLFFNLTESKVASDCLMRLNKAYYWSIFPGRGPGQRASRAGERCGKLAQRLQGVHSSKEGLRNVMVFVNVKITSRVQTSQHSDPCPV